MRVVRNILAASGVIGSLFASAGVKEVLLPERYVQGDVSAVRKIESAAFEKFADLAVVLPPEIRTHDISSYSTEVIAKPRCIGAGRSLDGVRAEGLCHLS